MRDWRKIILIASITFGVLIVIGVLAYMAFSHFTKEERPPLDIAHAKVINFEGDYDQINLPEYGVNFKIIAGGEITQSQESYNIKGDNYSLGLEIIPFNTLVLHTDDSLRKYESDKINYTQKDEIELINDYKEVYGKKRGDIFISENNEIIRVLKDTSYINNSKAIGSIEILKGDINELYKIFIGYYGTKEQKEIESGYELNDEHKEKGLEYHKHFTGINNSEFKLDIFGFGGVYNKNGTDKLKDILLEKTNESFKEKYGTVLEKDEIKYYQDKINEDKNRYFSAITFKRIIIENNNIYQFTFEIFKSKLNLETLLGGNFENFFIKDIKITEPKESISGKQAIFDNMQFIIPSNYVNKEVIGYKEKYLLVPSVKKYKKGSISININKKEHRKETIDEVYKKNISKYVTESLSLTNKSIVEVEHVKSDNINIGGFDGVGNIFKFKTVNGDDFIFNEYILFNSNRYYTINFSYGENEKELKSYFNNFMKSINKIK